MTAKTFTYTQMVAGILLVALLWSQIGLVQYLWFMFGLGVFQFGAIIIHNVKREIDARRHPKVPKE
jgi:hypothetical protein